MKQYNYIYKITNLANGKIYIGKHSTDNLNDSYMGSGKIIKNARSKYGKNAFKKDIIAFSDNEDSLNLLEKFYIKKYKSQDSSIGYNLTDGGEGTLGISHSGEKNPMYGKHHSDETKAKIIASHKGMLGKHLSEESKAKISVANKGRHHTDETRQKLSELRKGKAPANKGKHLTEEAKAIISAKAKGRKVSDEARKKMSIAHKGKTTWNKGKHLSEETRAKIGAAWKGRHHTEEAKAKMSESQKLRRIKEKLNTGIKI